MTARPLNPTAPRGHEAGDLVLSSGSSSAVTPVPSAAPLSARDILAQARQVEVRPKEEEKKKLPKALAVGNKKIGMWKSVSPVKDEYGKAAAFSSMAFREAQNKDYGDSTYRPQALPLAGKTAEVPEGAARIVLNEDGSLREREFVLFQLPKLLPTLHIEKLAEDEATKGKKSGYKPEKEAALVGTPLSELPDGRLGTMRVYASGRVVAVIGNIEFEVDEGHKGCFRQEIACICPEEQEVLFLGQVSSKLILSPAIFDTDTSMVDT